MATRNIVPRATGEGQIGTSAKTWSAVYANDIAVTNGVTASTVAFTTQGEVGFRGTTHTEPTEVCKQVIVTAGSVDSEWIDGNAKLALHTYDSTGTNSAENGSFVLQADDGTNAPFLEGFPNGDLKWNNGFLVPTGVVQAFAGQTTPAGWLLCDGSAVSRVTYAKLFSVIGTSYGVGDGSTTFNVPNLIDKFVQGNATAGTVKSAGLPNITGDAQAAAFMSAKADGGVHSSGAFSSSVRWTQSVSMTTGTNSAIIKFSASDSNSIYGNSTTVQPPALTMRYIIKY